MKTALVAIVVALVVCSTAAAHSLPVRHCKHPLCYLGHRGMPSVCICPKHHHSGRR